MSKMIVGYVRVSTKGQGASGLGLEAQRQAIETFARQSGAVVIAAYTEVESGRKSDREELAKAVAHSRRSKATLVVAKLDRLSRNVAFLSTILEAGVEFVACDNPAANKLTLHILAAVAEAEADAISARTRAALAAHKARGGILGAARPESRNLTADARQRGAEASGQAARSAADAAYRDLLPVVCDLRGKGLSLAEIAARLNRMGHTTRRGRPWNAVQVSRVLNRSGASSEFETSPPRV